MAKSLGERHASTSLAVGKRPHVLGKFLFCGTEKLYLRGVTYGTFRPGEDGNEYADPSFVDRDFEQIARNGLNAVRTYTVPPLWLLDLAQRHGLRVMIGLPWEQHVAFLDNKRRASSIRDRVRAGVRACAGHPAVLCYAIGNEIPSSIVRWHGRRRVERFLEQLYKDAKEEDTGGLVTYVNYPSTEYLELPFVDLVCFNVYLESQNRLEAYLARLHNIAGDRPLIMAEIGMDSQRHGEEAQARVLRWQVQTAFASGCAGTFVFAWTDEWYRGGYDILDWDFGVTDRNRNPKASLASVRSAYAEAPLPRVQPWPRISVVVCSHNGARTIRHCLEGLQKLEYPDFEVIVVDDGSTDATAAIAGGFDFRLISTENHGLSSARNTGLQAATGEIVAYTDDDASPDPHWLSYLASTFMTTGFVAVGGTNIAPHGDGMIADCVANAPGGPMHVLLSDREAEHIPGCNMAFRRSSLVDIGGFDPQFRAAGDDVDVCWRLQERGWKIGFNPAAIVWHHRRNSVRAFWKQQVGYGKAEALLERKWPERFNGAGHMTWTGRIYGRGLTRALRLRSGRIYHGIWGTGLFQSLYQPAPSTFASLVLMPEWYLVILTLAALSGLSILWRPLLAASPLLALAIAIAAVQAGLNGRHAWRGIEPGSLLYRLEVWGLTASLHMLQPLARLCGRLRHGLTPWRQRGTSTFRLPLKQTRSFWSERWQAPDARLQTVEAALREHGAPLRRGGDFDRWDLEVRGGLLGFCRTRVAIEEHGAGKQLVRYRLWPRCSVWSSLSFLLLASLSAGALLDHALAAAAALGIAALLLGVRAFKECGTATGIFLQALEEAGTVGAQEP